MAEYIDRERIPYNMVISGYDETTKVEAVKKSRIEQMPTADVVERSKIDAANEEIKEIGYAKDEYGEIRADVIGVWRVLDILKKHIGGGV